MEEKAQIVSPADAHSVETNQRDSLPQKASPVISTNQVVEKIYYESKTVEARSTTPGKDLTNSF